MDVSKPEPPTGVPAGPYPNERLERCSLPVAHQPHRIPGSAMYRSRWCDGQTEAMPERIQNLPIPGMEAMTDEQLERKLVILRKRKVELQNMLKGHQAAIDTALQILDERHP